MNLEIKEYVEQRDFESIVSSCIKEGWVKFYTDKKELFRKALLSSEAYVAYWDGSYCGFIRCITDGAFTIYCCEIIVDADYRRKDIGSRLIDAVCKKYPSCLVDVISDNDDFYKANGFIILGNGMRKICSKPGEMHH